MQEEEGKGREGKGGDKQCLQQVQMYLYCSPDLQSLSRKKGWEVDAEASSMLQSPSATPVSKTNVLGPKADLPRWGSEGVASPMASSPSLGGGTIRSGSMTPEPEPDACCCCSRCRCCLKCSALIVDATVSPSSAILE